MLSMGPQENIKEVQKVRNGIESLRSQRYAARTDLQYEGLSDAGAAGTASHHSEEGYCF
jgi:hypothetical protein